MALKLELPEETLHQVEVCWQGEAKQLEMILQCWQEKHGNTEDFAMLRKALEGLKPEGKLPFLWRSQEHEMHEDFVSLICSPFCRLVPA